MARSKKTTPEQEPEMLDAGMDFTQTTPDNLSPQTESEFFQDEGMEVPASQIDPEGCQADESESPDSQTDSESYQAEDPEAPIPQIGSESGEYSSDPEGFSHTEMEASAFGIDSGLSASQAENSPQTDAEPAEETPDSEAETKTEPQSDESIFGDTSQDSEAPPVPQTDTAQPRKLRMPRQRRDAQIVSIDAERSVETDADRLRSDLLDLVESMKGRKILTDMIQGVERPSPNSDLSYAVIYHGSFKVIIPVLEMLEEPEDYRGQPKGDVLNYLLNKRLGAEVDYIVKGVDQETGVAAASRLEAMARKRREYYFRTDLDGNYPIYEGIRAEARVVSVIRAGIFVDLFGVET